MERAAWTATPRHQGIDQRVKGFICPETLRAVPPQSVYAVTRQTLDCHLDKGCFPYACLARDEGKLSFAVEHSLRHGLQCMQSRSRDQPANERVPDAGPLGLGPPAVSCLPTTIAGSTVNFWGKSGFCAFAVSLSRTR